MTGIPRIMTSLIRRPAKSAAQIANEARLADEERRRQQLAAGQAVPTGIKAPAAPPVPAAIPKLVESTRAPAPTPTVKYAPPVTTALTPAAAPNPALLSTMMMAQAAPASDPMRDKYGDKWEQQDYDTYAGVQGSLNSAQSALDKYKAGVANSFIGSDTYNLDNYLEDRTKGTVGKDLYTSWLAKNPQYGGGMGLIAQNNAFNAYSKNLNSQLGDYDRLSGDIKSQQTRLTDIERELTERNQPRLNQAAAAQYQATNPAQEATQAPVAPGVGALPGQPVLQQDAGFTPSTAEGVAQMQNLQDTVGMWENIFGKGEKQAYQAANEALDYDISALNRRQQELSARSGRSALGGGYGAGAAQAALSAGKQRSQLVGDFYQNRQSKKQSFLQSQLDRAEREGRSKDARELSLLLANIDLEGTLGSTEAMSEYYDQLLRGTR